MSIIADANALLRAYIPGRSAIFGVAGAVPPPLFYPVERVGLVWSARWLSRRNAPTQWKEQAPLLAKEQDETI
jgi:hypothetical protein